ncbi:unnamed protein product [Effrenium voratum]|uniref:Uncharacterized protein n=1 Tax=Effrenium voratum TaxID=2562239 RepID=A0AA36MX16_9DINO|nr:unnamed protein product [Effrenium voratum]CAJ1389569.1 unnamed protein product [Effrenium voratum]CAJ1443877.1 unnamed protein product [Effrenium voratum]
MNSRPSSSSRLGHTSPPLARAGATGATSPPWAAASLGSCGHTSPPFRPGVASPGRPGALSPPRLIRAPDASSRASLESGALGSGLGASYSIQSLLSTDSGPAARLPPKSHGAALGQVLQAPVAPQLPALVPPLPRASAPGIVAASGVPPAPLFGRMLRPDVRAEEAAPPVVAKPMWIIEEVIDFDAAEEDEEASGGLEQMCQPKMFRSDLLEGCFFWNCTEDEIRVKD